MMKQRDGFDREYPMYRKKTNRQRIKMCLQKFAHGGTRCISKAYMQKAGGLHGKNSSKGR